MDSKLVETYLDFIAGIVVDEDKIITYKSLSRNLNIHVNTAKQLLYLYLTNEKSKNTFPISATYLIAGKVIDGSFNISVVNESNLKAAYSNLIQVTSEHVYSVQKGKNLKEIKCLYGVDKDSTSNSSKLVIKHAKDVLKHNEEVKKKSHSDEADSKNLVEQALTSTEVNEKKIETTHKKSTPKGTSAKDHVNTENRSGHIADMFAKANQKNTEKSVKNPVKYKPKSNSHLTDREIKKEKETSERRDNLEESLKKKKHNKRRRIQMMSDSEESENDEEEEAQIIEIDKEPETQHVETVEEEGEEKEKDEVLQQQQQQQQQQQPQQSPPFVLKLQEEIEETKEFISKNTRKKRKVIDKTVMSEDGYLETKKEVVFETDSEDEVEEVKPKEEKKPKLEKKKGAQAAKKQSSLLLFFKKG